MSDFGFEILSALGGLFLLVCVLPTVVVIVITYVAVRMVDEGIDRLALVDPLNHPDEVRKAGEYADWARANDFHWVGAYEFNVMSVAFIAVWARRDEPTFFSVYVLPNGAVFRAFTSVLSGDHGLDTASNVDSCLLPNSPGSFMQAFPNAGVEEQWERHREALRYLASWRRVHLHAGHASLEECFTRHARRQMQYIKSLPLWPLRGPYWYFVRRMRMPNQTVEDLDQRGYFVEAEQV